MDAELCPSPMGGHTESAAPDPDFIEMLGGSSAADPELKERYRGLVQIYHPDHNGGSEVCEERFKELNEAYQFLCDQEKTAPPPSSPPTDWQQAMAPGVHVIEVSRRW